MTAILGLASAYGWGVISSLSACVYPLIPITTALFVGREKTSFSSGLILSGTYVLGMSITYTILGLAAALSGAVFGAYLAEPSVILAIALLLVYLGLAYAEVLPMPLPNFANKFQVGKREGLLYPLLLGLFSGFIAAPCTAPFFGALLTEIARDAGEQKSIFLPSAKAFAFALGMGLPFLLVGVFSLKLPKPGSWLQAVKYAGSVVLIAAGFHYLEDLKSPFPLPSQAFPFAVIGVAMCITFFILVEPLKTPGEKTIRVRLNIGGMLLISALGLFLFSSYFIQANSRVYSNGSINPTKSSVMELPKGKLLWYRDLAKAKSVAAAEKKVLLLDFWADWCNACEEMEAKLFTTDLFINFALENKIIPVRIDFSNPTDEIEKLANQYGVRGLPTLVIIKPDGELIHSVTGFYNKDYVMRELRSAFKD